MDISNLLSYCPTGPNTNNNTLIWFLILFIILGYGDQGYGCCKKKHRKHDCGFFGDGFFTLLILALIFLLSKSPCNTTTPC